MCKVGIFCGKDNIKIGKKIHKAPNAKAPKKRTEVKSRSCQYSFKNFLLDLPVTRFVVIG